MNSGRKMQLFGVALLSMAIILPSVGLAYFQGPIAYDNEGSPIYFAPSLDYRTSWIPWAFTLGIAFLVYGTIMQRRKIE